MSEQKKEQESPKKKLESGSTPGMLKDPFGLTKQAEKPDMLQQPLRAGHTPGMLKNPFSKKKRERQRYVPVQSTTPRHKADMKRILPPPQEPHWYRIAKPMFEKARVEKNLTDEQIEFIKELAKLMPRLLVKGDGPSFPDIISTEDAEVAVFLESKQNMKWIVETKAENFDPYRQWNRTFVTLSKKNRAQFWTALAVKVLEKLENINSDDLQ